VTYPVMLDGARFSALVVGGGPVAARKTRSLLDGEVQVTVVATAAIEELEALATAGRIRLERRPVQTTDVDSADIVVVATDDPEVNRDVTRVATTLNRLVNVADDPGAGNFVTPSVHRAGDVTVAVSTGRTPAAAAAIRVSIGKRIDHRYAAAIGALRELRERLFAAGRQEDWRRASQELIGESFCADVESGAIAPRIAAWR
jgi:precorrin-2 dehydrogenase / sirohydrochlorin ferrochelatase